MHYLIPSSGKYVGSAISVTICSWSPFKLSIPILICIRGSSSWTHVHCAYRGPRDDRNLQSWGTMRLLMQRLLLEVQTWVDDASFEFLPNPRYCVNCSTMSFLSSDCTWTRGPSLRTYNFSLWWKNEAHKSLTNSVTVNIRSVYCEYSVLAIYRLIGSGGDRYPQMQSVK
jgi:hypothetical protein